MTKKHSPFLRDESESAEPSIQCPFDFIKASLAERRAFLEKNGYILLKTFDTITSAEEADARHAEINQIRILYRGKCAMIFHSETQDVLSKGELWVFEGKESNDSSDKEAPVA